MFTPSSLQNSNDKRKSAQLFYQFEAVGFFAELERGLGLPRSFADVGQARFYYVLQANDFGSALVYYTTVINYWDLYYLIR